MHEETEIADVVVVLTDEAAQKMDPALDGLKAAGLSVTDVDNENGVIEGTILADKVGGMKKLAFVKYVRRVFDYEADLSPSGDEGDGEDTDDAGQ